jgi:hypothetical protein
MFEKNISEAFTYLFDVSIISTFLEFVDDVLQSLVIIESCIPT